MIRKVFNCVWAPPGLRAARIVKIPEIYQLEGDDCHLYQALNMYLVEQHVKRWLSPPANEKKLGMAWAWNEARL